MMNVKIRFFAKFRELLGAEVIGNPAPGTTVASLVRDVASRNKEGHNAIFDEKGSFREFVIIMRNGKRLEHSDAEITAIGDGDEIAVFPPVAGG
jgi:molybdopterin synthase sulfur carrier subunit